jgi:hypothetical protein
MRLFTLGPGSIFPIVMMISAGMSAFAVAVGWSVAAAAIRRR